jgi:predicted N-acetyltransferase YhbS
MKKRNYRIRTYREGDEKKIVEMLPSMRVIDRDRELGIEYWTWKNKLSPYFDPSLIVVAEENKEVIGCAHAQVKNLKISDRLIIRATQPADLFIRPEHRRRGVATEITSVLRKNLRKRGAIALFGVASPLTHKTFYSKRKGDKVFRIPGYLYHKTIYVRKLNCASFRRRASLINKALQEHHEIRDELMKLNLTVLFRLKGFPPFVLEVSGGKVAIKEGQPIYKPNVVITASRLSSPAKILTLIKMFFSGDVKVKGLLRNFLSLYRCFKILRKVNRILHQNKY